MVFKAQGKLLTINKEDGVILANIKEGFLGSNHTIKLQMDKKFTSGVLQKLKHSEGFHEEVEEGIEFLDNKELENHKITIIIE